MPTFLFGEGPGQWTHVPSLCMGGLPQARHPVVSVTGWGMGALSAIRQRRTAAQGPIQMINVQ